jgi:hypothetical protein
MGGPDGGQEVGVPFKDVLEARHSSSLRSFEEQVAVIATQRLAVGRAALLPRLGRLHAHCGYDGHISVRLTHADTELLRLRACGVLNVERGDACVQGAQELLLAVEVRHLSHPAAFMRAARKL